MTLQTTHASKCTSLDKVQPLRPADASFLNLTRLCRDETVLEINTPAMCVSINASDTLQLKTGMVHQPYRQQMRRQPVPSTLIARLHDKEYSTDTLAPVCRSYGV